MPVIINEIRDNPFHELERCGYEKKTKLNVVYQGHIYKIQYTYEKNIALINRLANGSLAFLGTLLIVPYFLFKEKIDFFWVSAIQGVDKKILLISRNTPKFFKAFPRQESTCKNDLIFESISPVLPPRLFPKLSPFDIFDGNLGGSLENIHGRFEVFTDDEIIDKQLFIRKIKLVECSCDQDDERFLELKQFKPSSSFKKIKKDLFAYFTKYEKAVLLQQSIFTSRLTACAMLILDQGKRPNVAALRESNLASFTEIVDQIRKSNLDAMVCCISTIEELKDLITQNGSCLLDLNSVGVGHSVIVDAITDDLSAVRLRDPYHGWEITVSRQSFLNNWVRYELFDNCIQIVS